MHDHKQGLEKRLILRAGNVKNSMFEKRPSNKNGCSITPASRPPRRRELWLSTSRSDLLSSNA